MNVGDFDTPISIFTQSSSVNSDGIVSETYSDEAVVFADVLELTGGEAFKSELGTDISDQIARMTFWYLRELKTKDRVVYNGANWDIVNVQTVGRNEKTTLICRRTT